MSWENVIKKFGRKAAVGGTHGLSENEPPQATTEGVGGYEQGYIEGLRRARHLVEDAEGRPGKRQIAQLLQDEIVKAEER